MEIFLTYLKVFLVGGGICLIGQILINLTKMTSARILVTFLLTGIFLEAIGVFEHIKNFAQAGATIPILGFGSNLAKGAIEGIEQYGLIGAFTGGVKAAAGGIAAAVFFGYIASLISKPKMKKQ